MFARSSLAALSVAIVLAPLTEARANDPAAEVRQVTSAIRKKTYDAPKTPVLRPAQTVTDSDQPDGLFVGAVQVDGADAIPVPPLMGAVQKFVGRRLSQDELKKLLSAVANVARQRGYIFAKSSIPDQSMIAGVLHVKLDLGHIDEVRVVGLESREVEAILRPLLGHAPKISELDRQLALIADLPGMSVGQPAYALKGDRGVLSVPVKRNAFEGEAFVDNRGLKQHHHAPRPEGADRRRRPLRRPDQQLGDGGRGLRRVYGRPSACSGNRRAVDAEHHHRRRRSHHPAGDPHPRSQPVVDRRLWLHPGARPLR